MRRAGSLLTFLAATVAAASAWAHDAARDGESRSDAGGTDAALSGLLSPEDIAIYRKALELAEDRAYADARNLARTAREPLPQKIVHWLELTESLEAPGTPADFEAAATFIERNPDWPGQAALRRRAEQSLPDTLPDARITDWFARYPPLTAAGVMRFAEALFATGATERAVTVVRHAWVSQDFDAADERAFRRRFDRHLTRDDHVARLDRLLWDRKAAPAERQARRLGDGYPELAAARLLLARMGPGVDAAIRRVPAARADDPGLRYERARWRQRKGRYADTIALLDPPDPGLPHPELWWPLRLGAARAAFAQGDISVAYRIAAAHGLDRGLGFAESEWFAGWIALRFLAQPRTAYDHFERLFAGVTSPVSLARAAYWAGEAALALERDGSAGEWAKTSARWYAEAAAHGTVFYGQLARRRLGWAIEIDAAQAPEPSPAQRQEFDRRELVRLARMLGDLGAAEIQETFLARLSFLVDSPADYHLVADLAAELGRVDLAVRTAKAARAAEIILPDYLFPSIDLPPSGPPEPALVLAVVRQESSFYDEAVSRAGARGLMQLMPATARQVARRLNVPYNREKLLNDPEYNLMLGRAYLAELAAKYDGSYILALAAYNAGPARANQWIKSFGDPRRPGVDPVDWIESLPFAETRNYVQRILESLVVYRVVRGEDDRDPLQIARVVPARSWAENDPPE